MFVFIDINPHIEQFNFRIAKSFHLILECLSTIVRQLTVCTATFPLSKERNKRGDRIQERKKEWSRPETNIASLSKNKNLSTI